MMRVLIGDIIGGVLPESALLPKDALLGEQFRVSRSVARECIRGLEERGLVHVTHGRGARVTRPSHWHRFDPDVLAMLLADPDHRPTALRDFLECQRILLVQAASFAAERATPACLRVLREAFTRMRDATLTAQTNAAGETRFQEAEIAFYDAIGDASGNHTLRRTIEPVCRAAVTHGDTIRAPDWHNHTLDEHERILLAIESGDRAAARQQMTARLSTIEAAIIGLPSSPTIRQERLPAPETNEQPSWRPD